MDWMHICFTDSISGVFLNRKMNSGTESEKFSHFLQGGCVDKSARSNGLDRIISSFIILQDYNIHEMVTALQQTFLQNNFLIKFVFLILEVFA